MGLKQSIRKLFKRREEFTPSSEAYDLWSASYDSQAGNLMLDLDAEIFNALLGEIPVAGKQVVDVGCGTGRHWRRLQDLGVARIRGFDNSPGMIARLKEKFPSAEAFVSTDHQLTGVADASIDLIVSTLTIAHIRTPFDYFREWARVIRPGAYIILTDYHPDALRQGAKRTFRHGNETIAIWNYVHSVKDILAIAEENGFVEERYMGRLIDEEVKSYYEKQNAIALYQDFFGIPIIYGLRLKKPDAVS